MSTRFVPADIEATYAAIAALNNNFDEIATLFDLCVMRDGSTPNALLDDLDTNHFKIQNLADGIAPTDAATVGQMNALVNDLAVPITIDKGGTGAITASAARIALAVLGTAGGTVTGNIVRQGKGIHPYFNNANMTGGQIFVQPVGSDPTANPGDIVFEY